MRALDRLGRVAAHLTISLSVAFVFLVVLDFYNPVMGFLNNEVSIPLLLAFCACSALTAASRLVLVPSPPRGAGRPSAHGRPHGPTPRHGTARRAAASPGRPPEPPTVSDARR